MPPGISTNHTLVSAKTIASLEREGYVERSNDSADARRRIVRPTSRGLEFLALSAAAFEHAVTTWRDRAGDEAIDRLGSSLHQLGLPLGRFDLAAWPG